ncbi:MAG: patatin-like phospholipase family protein, partial [Bacteroidota bacterium]
MSEINDSQKSKRPKVGVIITGLGVKAIVAVPLFEFLEKEGIEVDLLTGTGGGAKLCALKAMGYDNLDMVEYMADFLSKKPYSKYDYKSIMSLFFNSYRFIGEDERGVIDRNFLLEEAKKTFGRYQQEDLKPKVIFETTDVYTGRSVTLSKGSLYKNIYAAASIYPYLPPVLIEGRSLVSGILSNPLPIEASLKQKMDIIIVMWAMDKVLEK